MILNQIQNTMGDLNSVYPLLGIVILIVLLCRFDGRFTKMEKELDVIKKQMDALLKRQAKMAPGDMTSSEEMPEKVVAEVLSKEKLLEEELVVQRQSTIVETAVVDNLKDAPKEISEDVPEKIQEEIIEKITVEDIAEKDSVISPTPIAAKPITPKPSKKQVNYEKFIGENLFGKIGILIFVIGVGFFVKYAIDKNWINETFRTVLGFLTGRHYCLLPNACRRNIVHSVHCLPVVLSLCSISRLLSHSIIIISSRRLLHLLFW